MAEKIIHELNEKKYDTKPKKTNEKKSLWINLGIGFLVVMVAIAAGKLLANYLVKSKSTLPEVSYTKTSATGGSTFGEKNDKLCVDQAEGTMRRGGADGEGTHHLQRKGGESQNVYLTSSTIDLEQLVGKKVQVWGKTYSAQTAGWLMDACYIVIK
jgi:hypothetical protein